MAHKQGAAATTYSFPLLKAQQILECMSDLQIPFAADDLARPTPQVMLTSYEHFAEALMGVTREDFAQPSVKSLSDLSHPEIYTDCLALMGFFKHLHRLMMEVGVLDFNLRDIIKPEAERVRRILSALINFAKFRGERISVFDELQQASDDLNARRAALVREKEALTERVNTLSLQVVEDEAAMRQVRESNAALKAQMREMKHKHTEANQRVEDLTRERSDLSDKVTHSKQQLEAITQDMDRMRVGIVDDPEQLRLAIREMSASLQNGRDAIAQLEKKRADLQTKADAMAVVDESVAACIRTLEDCRSERARFDAAVKQLSAEQERAQQLELERSRATQTRQAAQRKLGNAQEKLRRLQSAHAAKRAALDKELVQLRSDADALGAQHAQRAERTVTLQTAVSTLEARQADLRRQVEATDAAHASELKELNDAVSRYQTDVLAALRRIPVLSGGSR